MVVNSKGRARTQRVDPKLALVEVQLPPEAFLQHWEPTIDSFMGILHYITLYHILYLYILFINTYVSCFYLNSCLC